MSDSRFFSRVFTTESVFIFFFYLALAARESENHYELDDNQSVEAFSGQDIQVNTTDRESPLCRQQQTKMCSENAVKKIIDDKFESLSNISQSVVDTARLDFLETKLDTHLVETDNKKAVVDQKSFGPDRPTSVHRTCRIAPGRPGDGNVVSAVATRPENAKEIGGSRGKNMRRKINNK